MRKIKTRQGEELLECRCGAALMLHTDAGSRLLLRAGTSAAARDQARRNRHGNRRRRGLPMRHEFLLAHLACGRVHAMNHGESGQAGRERVLEPSWFASSAVQTSCAAEQGGGGKETRHEGENV